MGGGGGRSMRAKDWGLVQLSVDAGGQERTQASPHPAAESDSVAPCGCKTN